MNGERPLRPHDAVDTPGTGDYKQVAAPGAGTGSEGMMTGMAEGNRLKGVTAALVLSLVLAAGVVLLYLPSLGHPFLGYDDNFYVTENRAVAGGLTLAGARWAFTTTYVANWHPLTWLSHMLDVSLFGLDPGKHRLTSVLLHAANSILLFLVLRGMTGALWRSFAVSVLFAVHPLRVESVAWVAERKDVLSTFFMMLSLAAYRGYVRRPGIGRYLPVCLAFTAALMSKAMVVTLPFVLLLLDWWPLGRLGSPGASRLRAVILEKVPLLLLASAVSWVTFTAQARWGAVETLEHLTWGTRAANALVSYVRYLGMAAWPDDLSIHYLHPGNGFAAWRVAVAALILVAATAAALRLSRRRPWLAVGWLWYLGTLVPVIGLVQVGSQAIADRYTYVPLIGILVALVWEAASWFSGPRWGSRAAALAVVGAVTALSFQTRARLEDWSSAERLFRRAVAVDSRDWVSLNLLGIYVAGQGRYREGEELQRRVVELNPAYVLAYYHLGRSLDLQGRLEEAAEAYRRGLEAVPSHAESRNNLGFVLLRQGRTEEAVEHLLEAVRRSPSLAVAHTNLGNALMRLGRSAEARKHIAEGMRLARALPE